MPTMKITKGQLKQIIRESYYDLDDYDLTNTQRDALIAVKAAIVAVKEAGDKVGKMMYNENEGASAFEKLTWMHQDLKVLEFELMNQIQSR